MAEWGGGMMAGSIFSRQAEVIWLPQRSVAPGFTARDRAELDRWASADRRLVFCDGDGAPFAMLHDGATPWASWAVARQDGAVLVWNCVSLEDLGHFASMADALSTVLGAFKDESLQASNIIPFAAARARLGVHITS